MDIKSGTIGPEAKWDVKFEAGKLVAEVAYEGALLGAKTEVHIGAEQVVKAIEAAIPGKIDDVILDLLLAELLKA